jgi:hypothetical protein
MEEIEVLFEYERSKTMLKCTRSEIKGNIQAKLETLGHYPKAASSSEASDDNFILQKFSKKWDTFVDVDSLDSVVTGDRLSVILINSQKKDGNFAERIISNIKKPSQADAKALSAYFPSRNKLVKSPPFDPSAESVVTVKHSKKKRGIKRMRPTKVTVVMLDEFRSSIPKGKYRQKLASKGKIQSVLFERLMSPQEVKNTIIRAFGVNDFVVLDCDSTGHSLIRCADQLIDGERIVERKGGLYLCKESKVSI